MQNNVDAFLAAKLQEREDNGNLRKLFLADGLVDFCSNDYLGLANHTSYKIDTRQHGATGSRLITGNHPDALQAEKIIAATHNAESALIFNTGYMANLGLCSALGDKSTVFFCDEYIHASTIDGVRLSRGTKVKFLHNDVEDLRRKLSISESPKKIILVESVYSMNGDLAPLKNIVEVAEEHNALLIVDEAHATGILGNAGCGLVQALGLEERVWCSVHTYSKAMGLHGAAVVGSKILTDYLINFARSFIYATALPEVTYRQIILGYQLFKQEEPLKSLKDNIKLFHKLFQGLPAIRLSETPIQILRIEGNENARSCSEYLKSKGIYAKAILSPTLPPGKECIRICLHSFNSREQIELLFQSFQQFLR